LIVDFRLKTFWIANFQFPIGHRQWKIGNALGGVAATVMVVRGGAVVMMMRVAGAAAGFGSRGSGWSGSAGLREQAQSEQAHQKHRKCMSFHGYPFPGILI
jgi:hypothetical protein